ncbi:MAG: VOC family protein [Cytophagales bacterium]|nr:VOC family protein [Cytophagales bacterium]
MRLDHIAYRVADRHKAAKFFMECFGYRIPSDLPDGFDITFEDGTKALCYVLVPPEKIVDQVPWSQFLVTEESKRPFEYHLAPEIFISDGTEGSIVKEWVKARGGIGGIHHLAYQVESVEDKMEEWKRKGFAEFTTTDPLRCEGLTQVFTKPSALTGIIYEFIEREKHGFCRDNVRDLMKSTKEFSR